MNARLPIGVFDSGIGGLTVVRALAARLPHEHIAYFGDTARVPYGVKSVETYKARLMDKLKAVETTHGTLLDHTVLLLGGSQISSHSGGSSSISGL